MAENTVKVDISFQALLAAISSLEIAEKRKLWELLEAELFPDDEDSPEDVLRPDCPGIEGIRIRISTPL